MSNRASAYRFIGASNRPVMAFTEGETLYLQDEEGKRHWFRYQPGMIQLGGLGSIDGSRFAGPGDGDSIEIAGRWFNVFRPGVREI